MNSIIHVTKVTLEELMPIMEEQLSRGGRVSFKPKGISMLPLIRQGKDSVTLEAPPAQLKKYDIPLYRRQSGQFVLHRVVSVGKDGTYTMCGDNQWLREKGITHHQIIGVVCEIERNGKKIPVSDPEYLKYSKKKVKSQHIKGILNWCKGKAVCAVHFFFNRKPC